MRALKKLSIFVALSVGLIVPAIAQTQIGSVSVQLKAYPLVPVTSEIIGEVKTTKILPLAPLESTSLRVWYLGETAYLLPGSFFELGTSFRWNLGGMDHPPLVVGIGTAFSMDLNNSAISIPLIIDIEGRYRLGRTWTFDPQISALIYGEGILAEAELNNLFKLFSSGFNLDIGAHFEFAYSDAKKITSMGLGLEAGLAYYF